MSKLKFKCSECGKPVAQMAWSCPHCGKLAPSNTTDANGMVYGLIVAGLVIGACFLLG